MNTETIKQNLKSIDVAPLQISVWENPGEFLTWGASITNMQTKVVVVKVFAKSETEVIGQVGYRLAGTFFHEKILNQVSQFLGNKTENKEKIMKTENPLQNLKSIDVAHLQISVWENPGEFLTWGASITNMQTKAVLVKVYAESEGKAIGQAGSGLYGTFFSNKTLNQVSQLLEGKTENK